jgi:predicted RNase H-like HicB family nuclease
LVRTRGDHRQFKHPTKPGRVKVAGKPGDDLPPGTLNSILKQAGLKQLVTLTRYAIVVEKAEANDAAYVPDLPGCVATEATVEETEARLREAIGLHLEGMREDGRAIPEPSSIVDYVETSTAHEGRLEGHRHRT